MVRALELAPGYCEAHLGLIAVDIDRGDSEAAMESYNVMLERCADDLLLERAEELLWGMQ